MVLHGVFEGPGIRIYASDWPDAKPMKGCALLIEEADEQAATTLFALLADGGEVTLPLKEQFWGEHFGTVTDKFGVQWVVACRKH